MFCSTALHTALVTDLVAAIRETESAPQPVREQRLCERLDAAGLGASLGEMLAVAERAREQSATDEELGLALGLVLALSKRGGGRGA